MTEYMGSDADPFHLGKQSNADIRRIFMDAGFERVTVWRTLCVSDVWTAKKSIENYRAFSSVERDETFWTELETKYQGWLDLGEPLGLEAVIVLCIK
jgi:hypothetical protein